MVVGADGTPCSEEAVRWAAHQAELCGCELQIVVVWHWPVNYGFPAPMVSGFDPAAQAMATVDEQVEELRREHPALTVRTAVVEGAAGPVLVEMSHGAELLVVGTRGHGGLVGLVIGSVSEHCVTHAHCPVVVVRPKQVAHPAGNAAPSPPVHLLS